MEVEGGRLFEDLESGEKTRLEGALTELLRHFNEGKDVSKYWEKMLVVRSDHVYCSHHHIHTT